jgi:hypothetical protein
LARFGFRVSAGAVVLCLAAVLMPATGFCEDPAAVHVRLPDPLSPEARVVKYAEPLDEALRREGLGRVVGGGTQLSRERRIVSVEVDLQLLDLDRGVPFVRRVLRDLGAPRGSMVEFERFGLAVELPVHE